MKRFCTHQKHKKHKKTPKAQRLNQAKAQKAQNTNKRIKDFFHLDVFKCIKNCLFYFGELICFFVLLCVCVPACMSVCVSVCVGVCVCVKSFCKKSLKLP